MAWILFFWQPLAVFFPSCGCEPGWAISEASPCDHWADLHRKGPTKGSNKTDPIRSYQHLDDKTLANISHCNVLFPAETKAMLQISYHFWLLLRPVSVRTFEVGHVTSVCAGFMADPLASGVEALHHWTHCDRVLFSCVACRKRHGIWGCRVWRAQPLMFADGHASALILTWQGFYLPRIVGCLRDKGTQISSPIKFPHVGPQNRSSRHFGHDLSAENGCFEWTRQNFQSTPQKDQTIHQNHNNN